MVWGLVAALVPAMILSLLVWIMFPQWSQLVVYYWYGIPSNTFIHLPHEPAVIYAGAIYNPWLVAGVGGASTAVSSIVDYTVIRKVFQFRGLASIKSAASYRLAVRWFQWQPWATIVVFAFTPLPFDAIRVLAPTANYPLAKYVSANLTGRIPAYYLLALGGAWLPVPLKYLIPVVVMVSLAPVLYLMLVRLRSVPARGPAVASSTTASG